MPHHSLVVVSAVVVAEETADNVRKDTRHLAGRNGYVVPPLNVGERLTQDLAFGLFGTTCIFAMQDPAGARRLVKTNRKALARQLHPDNNPDKVAIANQEMQYVNEAWEMVERELDRIDRLAHPDGRRGQLVVRANMHSVRVHAEGGGSIGGPNNTFRLTCS